MPHIGLEMLKSHKNQSVIMRSSTEFNHPCEGDTNQFITK